MALLLRGEPLKQGGRVVVTPVSECSRLRVENERLREALAFYADEGHYDDWHEIVEGEMDDDGEFEVEPVVLTTAGEDAGQRARVALAASREGGR
jgi:hypothetical protein